MEIEVRKLRDGLDLLKPVVPKTSKTLPIVTSVLLRNGVLYGTNLEVGVTIHIARSEDEYVLPYNQLVDLLGRVPASDTLTLTQENKTLTLSWSTGKASFTTGRPKDFPPVPEMKEPKFTA